MGGTFALENTGFGKRLAGVPNLQFGNSLIIEKYCQTASLALRIRRYFF
ncbi:Uncharacterized protein dnm_012490 [Desulfonema magnum]|uniref:Uncharacterized protein n=1 Tax=Desulfonema magnum TaxID=45655 RepID=A0A975GL36_9BACT|nr:Uncharacterized protein dnm_012490 [Desulfonema magnum]